MSLTPDEQARRADLRRRTLNTRVRIVEGVLVGTVGTLVRYGEDDDGAPTYWFRPDGHPSWKSPYLIANYMIEPI